MSRRWSFGTLTTTLADEVLEAYERLILDCMRGDHTLFTSAEGIESLWARSMPLLKNPPAGQAVRAGDLGPNAIHQLIAPNAWRLPFERAWRERKEPGAFRRSAVEVHSTVYARDRPGRTPDVPGDPPGRNGSRATSGDGYS